MIKALIFDCFGVFYTDPVFARMRDPGTSVDIAGRLHQLDEEAAEGELSKAEFEREATALLHENLEEVEHEFFVGKARDNTLLDYVQGLRGYYKVALLSNIGADMMDGFFTPLERETFFDAVILSGEVGCAKPDPKIFGLVCHKLNVLPSEAVMIDDMVSNVEAAKSLGMQGLCYRNFAQFRAELAVILSQSQDSLSPS